MTARPINVHPPAACEGRACCIHNPSDHPLRNAPMHWRADKRVMERICPHGIGHDDPDDYAYRKAVDSRASDAYVQDGHTVTLTETTYTDTGADE